MTKQVEYRIYRNKFKVSNLGTVIHLASNTLMPIRKINNEWVVGFYTTVNSPKLLDLMNECFPELYLEPSRARRANLTRWSKPENRRKQSEIMRKISLSRDMSGRNNPKFRYLLHYKGGVYTSAELADFIGVDKARLSTALTAQLKGYDSWTKKIGITIEDIRSQSTIEKQRKLN